MGSADDTGYRSPVDVAALAHNFRVFAAAECAGEPLYAALSAVAAGDDHVLALLMEAPYPQRRPVLMYAAIHDVLLAGVDHPLARFYRDVTSGPGLRTDVDRAGEAFRDFCRAHRAAIAGRLATRATQTNEIGRSAVLAIALSQLDDRPIALVDVGCSAGLNLFVDRYRIVATMPDGSTRGVGPDDGIAVPTTIVGGDPFARGDPRPPPIARRLGIDRELLDVRNERDARWLAACLWPSDAARRARLDAAIALARDATFERFAGDAVATLDDALAAIGDDARPVVFHSWVVSYLDRHAKRAFADRVRRAIVERDAAWISAESANVVPGLAPPALPHDADATQREATLWHLTTRVDGVPVARPIARSHPHGRWIDWLAS